MVSLAYPIDRLDKALLKWFVMINFRMPTPLAKVMLRSKLVTLGVWNLKTIDVDGELDNKAFNSYGQGPAKPLKSHWTQWWVSKKAFNGDSQTLRKSIDATGSCEEKHYHPITPRKWPLLTSRTKPKPKRPFSLLKHEKISPFFRGSPPCAIFHQLQYTAEDRRSRTSDQLNLVLLKKKAAVMLCSGGEVSSRSSFVGRPHVTIVTSARASVARLLDK